jgi:hypothetical protein
VVINEARNLQQNWDILNKKEKRSIIEVILDSIIIYSDEVEINLKDLPTNTIESPLPNPTSSELIIKGERTLKPVATQMLLFQSNSLFYCNLLQLGIFKLFSKSCLPFFIFLDYKGNSL